MLHLALKAFYPSLPPFPLLHVDTTWKFREMITFRDQTAARVGMDLIVHTNEDGLKRGVSPFTCSSSAYAQTMKTEALRQALNEEGFDAAFGGARRDEEKSRAKERIFSHRTASHGWDPKKSPGELRRPRRWRCVQPQALPSLDFQPFKKPDRLGCSLMKRPQRLSARKNNPAPRTPPPKSAEHWDDHRGLLARKSPGLAGRASEIVGQKKNAGPCGASACASDRRGAGTPGMQADRPWSSRLPGRLSGRSVMPSCKLRRKVQK